MASLKTTYRGFGAFIVGYLITIITYWIVIQSGLVDLNTDSTLVQFLYFMILLIFIVATIALPQAIIYTDDNTSIFEGILTFLCGMIIIYITYKFNMLQNFANMVDDIYVKTIIWAGIILIIFSVLLGAPLIMIFKGGAGISLFTQKQKES